MASRVREVFTLVIFFAILNSSVATPLAEDENPIMKKDLSMINSDDLPTPIISDEELLPAYKEKRQLDYDTNVKSKNITIIIYNLSDGQQEVYIEQNGLKKLDTMMALGEKRMKRQTNMYDIPADVNEPNNIGKNITIIIYNMADGADQHKPPVRSIGRTLMNVEEENDSVKDSPTVTKFTIEDLLANKKYKKCTCVIFARSASNSNMVPSTIEHYLRQLRTNSSGNELCSDTCGRSGKLIYKSKVHVLCDLYDPHQIQDSIASVDEPIQTIHPATNICHVYPSPSEINIQLELNWRNYFLMMTAMLIAALALTLSVMFYRYVFNIFLKFR